MANIVITSVLAAVLFLPVRFPIVAAVSFLNYDLKDDLLLLFGHLFYWKQAFEEAGLHALIKPITAGKDLIGRLMNVFISISLILSACYVSLKFKPPFGRIFSITAGIIMNNITLLV